jgi:hypothetical protein
MRIMAMVSSIRVSPERSALILPTGRRARFSIGQMQQDAKSTTRRRQIGARGTRSIEPVVAAMRDERHLGERIPAPKQAVGLA